MDAGDIIPLLTALATIAMMIASAAKKKSDKKTPEVVSRPLKEIVDVFGDDEEYPEPVETCKTEYRFEKEGQKAIEPTSMPVEHIVEEDNAEKIDKKKLIIYSEILKPKFDD